MSVGGVCLWVCVCIFVNVFKYVFACVCVCVCVCIYVCVNVSVVHVCVCCMLELNPWEDTLQKPIPNHKTRSYFNPVPATPGCHERMQQLLAWVWRRAGRWRVAVCSLT